MPPSFLRSDSLLRRQGRTARARRIAETSRPEFGTEQCLNIIIEEDETRTSTSSRPSSPTTSTSGCSSASQASAAKARRRHANVCDIRLARGMVAHDSNDVPQLLYDAPRPAPQPPSPQSSFDSFSVAFKDMAPQFPSPPHSFGFNEPLSPTSSVSSSRSQTGDLPLTPSTSDDDASFVNPYHIEIQPLVITKHSQRLSVAPKEYDSDTESDSEWYSRELSKMVTLCSPLPPSFPHHKVSRRDSSIFVPPVPKHRPSKAISTPSPEKSAPAAPTKRRSTRRSVIPNYPPPPPPVEPRPPSISSAKSIVDFPMHPSHVVPQVPPRPLPRSSIPADFIFEDDTSSAFSFSIYEVDVGGDVQSASSGSAYSQPSFDAFAAHDVSFDLDSGMMFPGSLPVTPNDVSMESEAHEFDDEVEFVFSDDDEIQSPTSPSLSYYHSSASGSPPAPSRAHPVYMEEHNLKSKWSTSTLASVHQEHARRGASSMLRLYFGGQPSTPKRGSAQSAKKAAVPPTPTSPFSALMSPRKAKMHARGSSDYAIGPYPSPVGVRRRGSVATISDAGSEESTSSTSSSGLRRKPIPVEMFLRSSTK